MTDVDLRPCLHCGKHFAAKWRKDRGRFAKFCSRPCHLAFNNKWISKLGGTAATDQDYRHGANAHLRPVVKNQVRRALRNGQIKRPGKCERCKVKCRPKGHHCDYAKPFELMWLCNKCHLNWHMGRWG